MGERGEALMRIVVGIVSGIILSLWKILIQILAVVNFVVALIGGNRNKDMADLCEMWNTQVYVFLRYMTFVTNERPMPFKKMTKSFSKFKR